MSQTVREVLTEAAVRANVLARKRDMPSDMFVTCLNLLKGVLQDFSNKEYIQAYKSEFEIVPNKEKMIIGKYKLKPQYENSVILLDVIEERPEPTQQLVNQYVYIKSEKKAYKCIFDTEYVWSDVGDGAYLFDIIPDLEITDLMTPTHAFYKDANSSFDWTPLTYISYDQMYSAGYGDYILSWKPINEGTYELIFTPRFILFTRIVKVIYNIEMSYKDNDVISLPTPYLELLTRALAYQISISYPRTDATKTNYLKEQYDELSRNLEASNASQRILTRDVYGGRSLMGQFLDGSFISNRWR